MPWVDIKVSLVHAPDLASYAPHFAFESCVNVAIRSYSTVWLI